jgi:signal peptidase I
MYDDVTLYPGDRTLVTREEVLGFVRGYVPFLGWIVIGFQESHWVKYSICIVAMILILFSS